MNPLARCAGSTWSTLQALPAGSFVTLGQQPVLVKVEQAIAAVIGAGTDQRPTTAQYIPSVAEDLRTAVQALKTNSGSQRGQRDGLRVNWEGGQPYEFWEDLLGAHNYGPL